jgi:GT2 family glycosyltransferase
MWFPCVYIKRSVIDRIGYLDEQFDGFGSDDLDYCLRSIAAGFMLAVTNAVYVKHLGDDTDSPTTFTRRWGEAEWEKQRSLALSKLRNKYNTCPESFDRFISTGDISYLDGLNKLLVDGNPK